MKFTLSWLKQFLETKASVAEIAESLTAIGLEVEETIDKAKDLQKFEVAYIASTKPHPSADKLKLCDVETKNNSLQIVCGASNARAGIKVVLANVGVEIPNGKFKIKESTIRGEKSCGMLCSEEELFLASKSEGIIELPEEAAIGEPFTKYYGLDDPVFVINVTPNRGDALGVYGIARDLAAKGIGTLKELEIPEIKSTFTSKIKLNVQDKEACPLFTFREIRNLKNKPSPDWLQKLLKNINVKPISSIVDVTNYISYSFGQPMHAYDADKIRGDIVVGHCEEKQLSSRDLIAGSSKTNNVVSCSIDTVVKPRYDSDNVNNFHALNDKKYLLTENDLVVRDGNNVQALAGIIGGANSSCTDSTTNIVLESACFNAKFVAASGRRLQIDTDSRYRFERNIDRNFTEKALNIATDLILSICGSGEVSEIVIEGEKEPLKKSLDFSADYLEKITGIKLDVKEIEAILNKLGFATDTKKEVIKITPPSWRHDINILEDIVEEITRIYGYDRIEGIKLPELEQGNIKLREYKGISSFKRILASKGYDEVVTNSFMNSQDAKLFVDLKEELFLLNPISVENDYMRPTILPNLLSIVQKNLARSIKDMAFFEIGPSFIDLSTRPLSKLAYREEFVGDTKHSTATYKEVREDASIGSTHKLPLEVEFGKRSTEATYLTAVISGSYNNKDPHSLGRSYDIFDLKSDLEVVLDYAGLSIDKCIVTNGATPLYYHPTRSVNLALGKNLLGSFGQIHPKILKHYDINQEIFAFELNITNLPVTKAKFGKRDEFAVSDFQANFRDYAFIIAHDQPVGEIISYINNLNKKLVKSVILFDIYSGDKLPKGKKSIAIRVSLQANDRTLTEEDLNSFSKDLVTSVEQKFQGTLRE